MKNVARHLLSIAADAAKKVIDSKQFELFKPAALGEMAYKYLFILENVQSNPANLTKSANKEYIFYRRHDETIAPIGTNTLMAVWLTCNILTQICEYVPL